MRSPCASVGFRSPVVSSEALGDVLSGRRDHSCSLPPSVSGILYLHARKVLVSAVSAEMRS